MKGSEKELILIRTRNKGTFQASSKILSACPSLKKDVTKNNEVTLDYDTEIVEKLIDFLNKRNYENVSYLPKPIPHSKLELLLDDKDRAFLYSLSGKTYTELFRAAMDLKIEPLLDLLSVAMAKLMREKTWKQLVKFYNPDPDQMLQLESDLRTKYLEPPSTS